MNFLWIPIGIVLLAWAQMIWRGGMSGLLFVGIHVGALLAGAWLTGYFAPKRRPPDRAKK